MIVCRMAEDGVWGHDVCLNNTEGNREPGVMKLVQKDGPQSNMLIPGKETREILAGDVSPWRRMKRMSGRMGGKRMNGGGGGGVGRGTFEAQVWSLCDWENGHLDRARKVG